MLLNPCPKASEKLRENFEKEREREREIMFLFTPFSVIFGSFIRSLMHVYPCFICEEVLK